MTPVESSNIRAIGRDGDDMLITFNKGSTYRYFDVPVDVTEALLSAPSVGKAFHATINGKYKFKNEDSNE